MNNKSIKGIIIIAVVFSIALTFIIPIESIASNDHILSSNYLMKNNIIIKHTDKFCNNKSLSHSRFYPPSWTQTHKSFVSTRSTIYFTNPDNNDVLRAGDIIFINGTITGEGFQYYIVEWGQGINPAEWNSDGITLINGGTSPIVNNTIAMWNTNDLNVADFYTVKITVTLTQQETAFIEDIYLDPTLKEGWPQRINFEYDEISGYYYWAGYIEPVVSDIDNDGYKEIIIYSGGYPPKLNVFRNDGSLYWKASVGSFEIPGGNLHIPLVGDINNDGMEEIIVHSFIHPQTSEVYAFNCSGDILPNWPVLIPLSGHSTLMMADLDQDGSDEIVVKANMAYDRWMSVIDGSGEIISEWILEDKFWDNSIESTPAVGNFDNDSELEIVVTDPSENAHPDHLIDEGVIHVYNLDGSEVEGWPVYTDGMIFSSPAVGDINNDGDNEIIVSLVFVGDTPNYDYGGVYAFDKNGNVLPGWPFKKGWVFISSPSLADFDGDGDLEIAISKIGGDAEIYETYVLHHDGKVASNWPQNTGWNDYYSTVSGDINNDGFPDVITTAGGIYGVYEDGEPGGVYAWNFKGGLINGFQKVTEIDAQAPATIADIDNDGKMEAIASSNDDADTIDGVYKRRGSIYVWELDGNHNPETMHWPTFHRDNQRTGFLHQLSDLYVRIIKPKEGYLYIKDNKICPTPFGRTILLSRPITIFIETGENTSKVEFYIDDVLAEIDTTIPYEWTWNKRAFFKHIIKVIAFNSTGETRSKSIDVWKFF